MKHKFLKVFIIFCFFMDLNVVRAGTIESEFISHIDKIKTYEAHFSQTIQDERGSLISKSEGDFVILRPGQFYWKSNSEDPVIIVADGTYLWTYDIALEQITQQDLRKTIAATPAEVLMGETTDILKSFEVKKITQGSCNSENHHCFELLPKNEGELTQTVEMLFNGDKLYEISMRDALGQHVVTTFSKIRLNEKIQDRLFKFKPPKGVDVIQSIEENR